MLLVTRAGEKSWQRPPGKFGEASAFSRGETQHAVRSSSREFEKNELEERGTKRRE